MLNAPVPPEVLTKPFPVRLVRVDMFCDVLTETVLTDLVSPVEKVSGTS
jgi:hypothetical protein